MSINSIAGLVKVIGGVGAGGILAAAVALAASNSGGSGSAPRAAQVVEKTPPSVVEATATNEAEGAGEEGGEAQTTPTSGKSPTPRKDCKDGWLPYDDPDGRFSFCYPENYRLSTNSRHDPSFFGVLAGVYPLEQEAEGFAVWFQWVAVSHSDLPVNSLCTSGGGKYPFTSRDETTRTLLGAPREVCYTDTFRDASRTELDYRSLALELPSIGSGVIRIRADLRPVQAEAKVLEVIETLRVR